MYTCAHTHTCTHAHTHTHMHAYLPTASLPTFHLAWAHGRKECGTSSGGSVAAVSGPRWQKNRIHSCMGLWGQEGGRSSSVTTPPSFTSPSSVKSGIQEAKYRTTLTSCCCLRTRKKGIWAWLQAHNKPSGARSSDKVSLELFGAFWGHLGVFSASWCSPDTPPSVLSLQKCLEAEAAARSWGPGGDRRAEGPQWNSSVSASSPQSWSNMFKYMCYIFKYISKTHKIFTNINLKMFYYMCLMYVFSYILNTYI